MEVYYEIRLKHHPCSYIVQSPSVVDFDSHYYEEPAIMIHDRFYKYRTVEYVMRVRESYDPSLMKFIEDKKLVYKSEWLDAWFPYLCRMCGKNLKDPDGIYRQKTVKLPNGSTKVIFLCSEQCILSHDIQHKDEVEVKREEFN